MENEVGVSEMIRIIVKSAVYSLFFETIIGKQATSQEHET